MIGEITHAITFKRTDADREALRAAVEIIGEYRTYLSAAGFTAKAKSLEEALLTLDAIEHGSPLVERENFGTMED